MFIRKYLVKTVIRFSLLVLGTFILAPFTLLLAQVAQGVLKVEMIGKGGAGAGLAQSPIVFIYRDKLGLEIKREKVDIDPYKKKIMIPEGAYLMIGKGSPVRVSVSGPPIDVVVAEGGNHKIDLQGDHTLDVQNGNVQITVLGGAPNVKLHEDTVASLTVQSGSPMVRIGDTASRLESGNQARFTVNREETVVEAFKGSVSLVNENGGVAVVQEMKTSTFDSKEVQTGKTLAAKSTHEIKEGLLMEQPAEGSKGKEEGKKGESSDEKLTTEEATTEEARPEETKQETSDKEASNIKKASETKDASETVSKAQQEPTAETPITVIEGSTQPLITQTSTNFSEQFLQATADSNDQAQQQLDTKQQQEQADAATTTPKTDEASPST